MPARHTVWLFATCSIALVLGTFLVVIRWWAAPISIGVLAWFAINGVLLARRVAGAESRFHWLFGPAWGLGFCAAGALVFWLLGGRGFWILLLAPWLIWILLPLPLHRLGGGLRVPEFTRKDWLAVCLLLLLVPLIVGAPFANVAEPVNNGGKAYRAYFTADFVWAMTVMAEVSKGDVPPKNPFLTGGDLNYYWLAHFLSAAEYRLLHPFGLTIEEVALANSVGYGPGLCRVPVRIRSRLWRDDVAGGRSRRSGLSRQQLRSTGSHRRLSRSRFDLGRAQGHQYRRGDALVLRRHAGGWSAADVALSAASPHRLCDWAVGAGDRRARARCVEAHGRARGRIAPRDSACC